MRAIRVCDENAAKISSATDIPEDEVNLMVRHSFKTRRDLFIVVDYFPTHQFRESWVLFGHQELEDTFDYYRIEWNDFFDVVPKDRD